MQQRCSISALYLQVPTLDGVDEFYRSTLGMQNYFADADFEADFDADADQYSCAYSETACRIVFRKRDVTPFADRANNQYWKVGITVKNLDVAVRYLREQGVAVSSPRQFHDIGYMSHLKDPNGFTIGLLQHGFEGHEQTVADGHPVGVQATLAHITLRVTDIQIARRYFAGKLGMRLLSVQPVSSHQFDLYFFTWSDEVLPNTDLKSVDNREWLWARPYTLIEIQHLKSSDAAIHHTEANTAGFDGFSFQCTDSGEQFVSCHEISA